MNNLLVGRIIKELRVKKQISMIDFAKKIKISQPYLSKLESGRQELSFSLLNSICREFGMTVSQFFQLVENNSVFHEVELNLETEDSCGIEAELDKKIQVILSNLTFEQKKGLYTLLFPYLKE
jgi:HTH-type transcriptional regulator / antitoxin PezA